MNEAPLSNAASEAIRVGSRLGLDTDDPLVVQESNNTVVWLRPHAIIAKVGKRSQSATSLVREYEVHRPCRLAPRATSRL